MRKWNVVALVLALGVMLAPVALAQQGNQERTEVEQLRHDLAEMFKGQQALKQGQERLARENASLREQLNQTVPGSSVLEQHINALADDMDYAAANVNAENAQKVTMDGEFRIRSAYVSDFDFFSGDGDFADDDGTYVDYRMRVGLNFNFDADVSARFVMQASGLYGGNGSDFGSSFPGYGYGDGGPGVSSYPSVHSLQGDSPLSMYEGWMQFDNVFGREELSVRAGRQEIVLGNEFQFGNNDYHAGMTWDGSHMQWSAEAFNLSLIWATLDTDATYNGLTHPVWVPGTAFTGGYGGTPATYDDTEMWALYFTLNSIENVTMDLYWIYMSNDGDEPHAYYHTVGARIAGTFDVAAGLDYNLEAAMQTGDLGGTDFEIGGWTVEAELGITFDAESNFRLYSRFLWAEGEDDDSLGYKLLAPEHHSNTGYRARYGFMEIIPMWDVLTWQVGATFDPATDWTIGATLLMASRDSEFWGDNDDMGWELDLFAENRYSAQTTVGGGVGLFFSDEDSVWGDEDVAVMLYMQARIAF